ncbi:hypothetical protein [Tsukamurella ocularis]|uniref:hypothetical protein n=1 Tax=Tsukamurella ocularis TaxID=1970234 RepID=UPI002169449E|nr:hypothetical protein [Tsukamurella ocularis]MCS3779376.1 hypothetical protein [Tsukamurella ocularis]MCS3789894.1 hypothetical protein [Tsukamurella ocularis]
MSTKVTPLVDLEQYADIAPYLLAGSGLLLIGALAVMSARRIEPGAVPTWLKILPVAGLGLALGALWFTGYWESMIPTVAGFFLVGANIVGVMLLRVLNDPGPYVRRVVGARGTEDEARRAFRRALLMLGVVVLVAGGVAWVAATQFPPGNVGRLATLTACGLAVPVTIVELVVPRGARHFAAKGGEAHGEQRDAAARGGAKSEDAERVS